MSNKGHEQDLCKKIEDFKFKSEREREKKKNKIK